MQRVQNLHYFSQSQLDVEIERAYLDKGFYGHMHVSALRDTETDFLIKAQKVDPVKDVIDELEEWDVDWGLLRDYTIGDLSTGTNLFIMPSEKRAPRYGESTDREQQKYGRWVGFVTDLDPVVEDREALARAFRGRWGVETQYRQFKHEFYPPTKSSVGRVRAFHFNVAQLFYNIWMLVNLELRDRYDLSDRRPLTSDEVLYAIRDITFEMDTPEE
jgi:IS4 transposase